MINKFSLAVNVLIQIENILPIKGSNRILLSVVQLNGANDRFDCQCQNTSLKGETYAMTGKYAKVSAGEVSWSMM